MKLCQLLKGKPESLVFQTHDAEESKQWEQEMAEYVRRELDGGSWDVQIAKLVNRYGINYMRRS